MRGGALPPALLCAALGLALSFAPRRALAPALLILIACAAGATLPPVPPAWQDGVFLAVWSSVVVTAATVHLPRGLPAWAALALAVNAGLWSGMVIASAGARADLARALPLALLALPGGWLVARRQGVAVKVAASWLIAIALLASALTLVPTPGYKPDHME